MSLRGGKDVSLDVTTVAPEGVSFDGSTDYLSRSTDFVGNVDSKTFTFSVNFYISTLPTGSGRLYFINDSFDISLNSSGFYIVAKNSAAATILNANSYSAGLGLTVYKNSWNNLLISIDLANASNRSVYFNDNLVSMTWTTYTNDNIDFTLASHNISRFGEIKGRLSNLFLDYTYRDLSIEANRRLFITAEGKPADWATTTALNGILMLEMKDASTAHINEAGTGDFTQQGLLATADRGANQDNCVASLFDGINDELAKGNIATDSNTIVLSFVVTHGGLDNGAFFECANGTGIKFTFYETSGQLRFQCYNTGPSWIATHTVSNLVTGRNYLYSISFDLSDVNKRHIFVNGIENLEAWTDYVNTIIPFTSYTTTKIGKGVNGTYNNPSIGELYFDTNYIDLATSNPFWDSETNKPIPVRTAMANLASNPLICSPISADNPTANYGSGSAWTLNGGGLIGARGASEYIARSAKFDGSTSSGLSKSGNMGMVDSKSISLVFAYSIGTNNEFQQLIMRDSANWEKVSVTASTSLLTVRGRVVGATNDEVFNVSFNSVPQVSDFGVVFISVDATNTSNRYAEIVNYDTTPLWSSYNNLNISLSTVDTTTIGNYIGIGNTNGNQCFTYFTTDYIDFSSEANRNLFVNQLGYPRDLTPLIEDATIPTPLFYLKFDDTSNLGLDSSGNNNHFTVNGSVTSGSDFNI